MFVVISFHELSMKIFQHELSQLDIQFIMHALPVIISIDCIDYVTGIAHGGILRVPSMLHKMTSIWAHK